ncbi:MAG: SH3 domain-containing protein [Paracoccaceae bacterium]
MIRLLLLLSAGIFITLQVGGKDHGQMRFGLMEAEKEAALLAHSPAPIDAYAPKTTPDELVTRAADIEMVLPASAPTVAVSDVAPAPLLVAAPAPQPEPISPANQSDVKFVIGKSVNVRSGPSTRDSVVGKLTRGEAVSVVWIEDNGWARVRVEGDGIDGFMSMDFLTDTAP